MTSHELATLALIHAHSEVLYDNERTFEFAIKRLISAGLVDPKRTPRTLNWRCTPSGREVVLRALDDAREAGDLHAKLFASLRRAVRMKKGAQ